MRARRPVVQIDRRAQSVRNEAGVREKFGVGPALIPDYLALVGDSADGYPGIPGIGAVTAARLVNEHGAIEDFPLAVLGERRELALLFKDLATLRAEPSSSRRPTRSSGRGQRAHGPRAPTSSETTACSIGAVPPTWRDAQPEGGRAASARVNADTSVRIASPANSSVASERSPAAASPAPHASVTTIGT